MAYEYYEKGYCQEMVDSHLYRVPDYRQCRCKERWKVGFKTFGGTIEYKNLCTRHKNDYLKGALRDMVISIEEIKKDVPEKK